MNLKLEVNKFNNEDVIATSCASAEGIAIIGYDEVADKWNCGILMKGDSDLEVREITDPKLQVEGYYHVDEDGNITDMCEGVDSWNELVEIHPWLNDLKG